MLKRVRCRGQAPAIPESRSPGTGEARISFHPSTRRAEAGKLKRWIKLSVLVLATGALLGFAMNVSDNRLEELARTGRIQEDAPVKAACSITVHAPPEKVWRLLTDIADWPKWQPEIGRTEIDRSPTGDPLESGTAFSWRLGGSNIRSRIALVEPNDRLVWTGKAYGARAIHMWKLERLPGDLTQVTTNESMDGPLLGLFYSSKKLQESNQSWLEALKRAAEE